MNAQRGDLGSPLIEIQRLFARRVPRTDDEKWSTLPWVSIAVFARMEDIASVLIHPRPGCLWMPDGWGTIRAVQAPDVCSRELHPAHFGRAGMGTGGDRPARPPFPAHLTRADLGPWWPGREAECQVWESTGPTDDAVAGVVPVGVEQTTTFDG